MHGSQALTIGALIFYIGPYPHNATTVSGWGVMLFTYLESNAYNIQYTDLYNH